MNKFRVVFKYFLGCRHGIIIVKLEKPQSINYRKGGVKITEPIYA